MVSSTHHGHQRAALTDSDVRLQFERSDRRLVPDDRPGDLCRQRGLVEVKGAVAVLDEASRDVERHLWEASVIRAAETIANGRRT